jgi:hypothetical protein
MPYVKDGPIDPRNGEHVARWVDPPPATPLDPSQTPSWYGETGLGAQNKQEWLMHNRQAPGMAQSQWEEQQAAESRGLQGNALSTAYTNAMGGGPSAAGVQQQYGMGSALSSALGGSGGQHGYMGMGQGSNMLMGAQGQADQARSNEMSKAMANYGQQAGQSRGGDITYRSGEDQQMARAQQLQLQSEQEKQSQIRAMEQNRFAQSEGNTKYAQQAYQAWAQQNQQLANSYGAEVAPWIQAEGAAVTAGL